MVQFCFESTTLWKISAMFQFPLNEPKCLPVELAGSFAYSPTKENGLSCPVLSPNVQWNPYLSDVSLSKCNVWLPWLARESTICEWLCQVWGCHFDLPKNHVGKVRVCPSGGVYQACKSLWSSPFVWTINILSGWMFIFFETFTADALWKKKKSLRCSSEQRVVPELLKANVMQPSQCSFLYLISL